MEITDSPTPHPTLSTPDISDEEKFSIQLRVSGLPFSVSISDIREEVLYVIKRTLLLLAKEYTSLKILNVELRNRRRMSSVSDAVNQDKNTPESNIHRQEKIGKEVIGDPSTHERFLQRDPFDVIFDVTVLGRGGQEWGPIIVEYYKDNVEAILNDIRESTRIRGFEVGERSQFKVCIMTSASDLFAKCASLVEARPRTAEPATTPGEVSLPKPDTLTPTSELMETPKFYYPSRPTTPTFNIPDSSESPTANFFDVSNFVPFASDYKERASIGLLWWEIILLIFAVFIILCLLCLFIGWHYRGERCARQTRVNHILEKDSNGSTSSPKSDWSDDDSESKKDRSYEQHKASEQMIPQLPAPPNLYQLAHPSQQEPTLQLAKVPPPHQNKTAPERRLDFVVHDDISTLPNRSLRDLLLDDDSLMEHSKPDPSSSSKKSRHYRRSAIEPSVYSRRSKKGKDRTFYLDNCCDEECIFKEGRKRRGVDPSMYSIGVRVGREAVDPSVSEKTPTIKKTSYRPKFSEDLCSLRYFDDYDVSTSNGDLENNAADDPSMYSYLSFPAETSGSYWKTKPEFYPFDGDSARSDLGWSKFGEDHSVCSAQSFRTMSPSDQTRHIIHSIQDIASFRSSYFANSTRSISSRSQNSPHHHGNDRSTSTHLEGDDIKSDNSAVTTTPVSCRARDPSYHLNGYHSKSIHVDDIEAQGENDSHLSTENLKASLTALTHSLRDDGIATRTQYSKETSMSPSRKSQSTSRSKKKGTKSKSVLSTGSRVSTVSFATTMEGDGTAQYEYLRRDPVVYC